MVVDGRRLSALSGGDGPGVVLLYGWPQTSHAWCALMPALAAQGYRVVAPDPHGTGASEHASDGFGKGEQAGALRQIFAYARNHPDEVERLVLMERLLPGLGGLEAAMDVARGGLFHFGFFMTPDVPELLVEGHEHAFFDWWFAHMSADEATFAPEQIDIVTAAYSGRAALASGFGHYRTLLDDGRVNRSWVDSGGMTMPVLAIGGQRAAASRLGGSLVDVAAALRAEVVAGSGHFVPQERPEALLALLVDILTAGPDAPPTPTRSLG